MNNNYQICLPIKKHKQAEVISTFNLMANNCDIFEVWLDHIQDLDLSTLISSCPKPLLCVCKNEVEKGLFTKSEAERINILIQSAKYGASFIDIGWHTDYNLISLLQSQKLSSKLIISHHDWEKTLPTNELIIQVKQMLTLKPDLIKYVSTANNIYDNNKILALAEYLNQKPVNFITMCMGNLGKISRVITPMMGSFLMYAPLSKEQSSAPGQLDINELKTIWQILQ